MAAVCVTRDGDDVMSGKISRGSRAIAYKGKYDLRVELLKNGFALALHKEGARVSKIEFYRQLLYIGKTPVEVARIGGMSDEDHCETQFLQTGEPEYFDTLIELSHRFLKENDVSAVIAHGNRFLYGRANYVPCFYHAIVTIKTTQALAARKQHTVRHFRDEDRPQVESLAGRFRRYHPRMLSHREIPDENITVVSGQRDEPLGYVRMMVQPEPEEQAWWGKIYVTELGGAGPAAMETLLRAIGETAAEHNVKETYFPFSPFHPFSRLCMQFGGTCLAMGPTNDPTKDEDMALILDLGAFLRALCPEFERRLRHASATDWRGNIYLRTDDDLASIDVDGPDVQAGGVHDGTTMATMLAVPSKILTQLLTGFRSFLDIRDEPAVSYSVRNREMLTALFPAVLPAAQGDFSLFRPQVRHRRRLSPAALKTIQSRSSKAARPGL